MKFLSVCLSEYEKIQECMRSLLLTGWGILGSLRNGSAISDIIFPPPRALLGEGNGRKTDSPSNINIFSHPNSDNCCFGVRFWSAEHSGRRSASGSRWRVGAVEAQNLRGTHVMSETRPRSTGAPCLEQCRAPGPCPHAVEEVGAFQDKPRWTVASPQHALLRP